MNLFSRPQILSFLKLFISSLKLFVIDSKKFIHYEISMSQLQINFKEIIKSLKELKICGLEKRFTRENDIIIIYTIIRKNIPLENLGSSGISLP